MKKAILLTAIAGTFALAANAQTPAQFKGETPSASNKLYILLEQTEEKTTFFTGNNEATAYDGSEVTGWNLSNAGIDDTSRKFYLVNETTGKKWGWKFVSSRDTQTGQEAANWFWPIQEESEEDVIYPFNLSTENAVNGSYLIYASSNDAYYNDDPNYNHDYDQNIYKFMLTNGGLHRVKVNGDWYTVQGDDIPWNAPNLANVMFISQAQMNFHNKAQEVANCLNPDNRVPGYNSGYNGEALTDLIAAIETEGTDWVGQLAALEAANEAYLAAVEAIGSECEDEYWMGGANPYTVSFTVNGNAGDAVVVTLSDDYTADEVEYVNAFKAEVSNEGTIGEDGTATVTVTFDPKSSSNAHKTQYGSQLDIKVAGVAVEAPIVLGADPILSFTQTWSRSRHHRTAPETTKTIEITGATSEPIEIPFYAYGFFGPGNNLARINVEGATDDIQVVASPMIFSENNTDEEGTLCGLKVTFAPSELGAQRTTVIVDCGIEGVEPLYLNINACQSAINVVEDEIRFGANGAEKVITLEYSKFDGVNDGKYVTYALDTRKPADPAISIAFVDANGDMTNELHGTGTIQAIVKYDPSILSEEDPGYYENTYTFFALEDLESEERVPGVSDQLFISRAIPALQVIADTKDEKIYIFNEENEEHLYELHFANVVAPYDPSDIVVRTTTCIYEVKDVYFTGQAGDGVVHFSVIFHPEKAGVEYLDQIVVTCGDVMAWPYTLSLKGSAAKVSAANVSGIESVEVEAANAAAFNVAGQRVNNNAKGLVIKNGVKSFNK